MPNSTKYLDQFVNGLRFLAKINKEYRKTNPDFSDIRDIILSYKTGEVKLSYDKIREDFLKPFSNFFLAKTGTSNEIANNCHSISHSFRETVEKNYGNAFPLSITIGNVFYKNENIYNLSKSSLKKILNEGVCLDKPLSVHVWLTLDDMTVVDLSIISTLIRRGEVTESEFASLALIWTEENPGDFWFEPILVDNDFFSKVDSGEIVYSFH